MKVTYDQEKQICKSLLSAVGMSPGDAEILADATAHSDFTGTYSHGLSRFVNYIRRFQKGAVDPTACIEVVDENQAITKFDCHNASGVIAVNKAYDYMLPKSRKYGICMATANNSSNIGCGNYYGWRAAKDGLVGLFCCNTVLSVAPYGGAEKMFGTNPIIIAAPAGKEYPLILDMSTSVIAWGKVQAAQREHQMLEQGWVLDKDGNPTRDPERAYSILPIAGYKGYGLAVMVEVFSALLSGACYGKQIGKPGEPEKTGFSMILVDVEKFMPLKDFKTISDQYIHSIKESRRVDNEKEIFLPGEIEFRKKEKNLLTGHDISDALSKELASLAAELKLIPENASLNYLIESYEK